MDDVALSRKLVAEALGTGALVMLGPGAVAATFVIARSTGAAFSTAQLGVIAFAFMMVMIAMIYTVGHVSGCHINPAVTLALAAVKKVPLAHVPGYLAAQLSGGIAGAFALSAVLDHRDAEAGLGLLSYSPGNTGHAFFAELVGTALLLLVVLAAVDGRAAAGRSGLAIASMVFAVITVVGPVTGAALNPARYLAPMVAAAVLGSGPTLPWGQTPAYLGAALAAAVLAAGIHALLGGVEGKAAHRRAKPERAGIRALITAAGPARSHPALVDAPALQAWIREADRLVDQNALYLTHLDAVIGDADHGTNMRRGLRAAVQALDGVRSATPGAVLAAAGQAFISNLGGAAGPLYGTGFRKAAAALGENAEVSAADLGQALRAALTGIQELGAAAVGDKTMVDAWGPAVVAYEAIVHTGGDLVEATRAAADAAERGLRATVTMQARKGRASYLGARTIGHEDPGAASTVLILCALATAIAATTAKVPA
jgi:phosphoenolpyruvate---glycerone phosphotransferase subunit DhaL